MQWKILLRREKPAVIGLITGQLWEEKVIAVRRKKLSGLVSLPCPQLAPRAQEPVIHLALRLPCRAGLLITAGCGMGLPG